MAETIALVSTFLATNAATIGTAASIGSGVLGAATAYTSARNEAAIMKAQAAQNEQAARDRRVASSIEAERLRRQNRIAMSRSRAGTAQAGALSGTSLDLLDQNSVALELDALTVQYGGDREAQSLSGSAGFMRSEAQRVSGTAVPAAAGSLLGGLSRIDPLNFAT